MRDLDYLIPLMFELKVMLGWPQQQFAQYLNFQRSTPQPYFQALVSFSADRGVGRPRPALIS